ncbi:hypothetical protein [Hydrogenivirga sp.]
MDRKTDVFKLSEYLNVLEEFQFTCWEEADYADECKPVDVKNLNGENRRKEDYYADFSDVASLK